MNSSSFVHDDDTGLVSGAIQIPSTNCDARPQGAVIDVLVIHAISLPPNCFGGGHVETFFANCLDTDVDPYFKKIEKLKVSSHFYINRQGILSQFVSTRDRAWHAGLSIHQGRDKVNDFSIGIELEGCDTTLFEAVQYSTLSSLTQILLQAFPAIHLENIVGHHDIAPERKSDPGPCFDWDGYRKLIQN